MVMWSLSSLFDSNIGLYLKLLLARVYCRLVSELYVLVRLLNRRGRHIQLRVTSLQFLFNTCGERDSLSISHIPELLFYSRGLLAIWQYRHTKYLVWLACVSGTSMESWLQKRLTPPRQIYTRRTLSDKHFLSPILRLSLFPRFAGFSQRKLKEKDVCHKQTL